MACEVTGAGAEGAPGAGVPGAGVPGAGASVPGVVSLSDAGVVSDGAEGALAVLLPNGEPAAATLVLSVGYRGTDFSGFAEQPDPRLRTVAGELHAALRTLLRREVELTCAGRTDAGVHALAQVVSVPVSADEVEQLTERRISHALAALLPPDMTVRKIRRGAATFSARFDALARSYRYRIALDTRPTFAYDFAWNLRGPLDVEAMQRAAVPLIGEHDFKSFCKTASAEGKPTHRNLLALDIGWTEEFGEPLIAVDVRGSSFLHNMVRALVGTLAEVGKGRRSVAWPAEVLAACDRRAAGPTAPAKGLTFMGVTYPAGSLHPWA